jgi:hypothetical protein
MMTARTAISLVFRMAETVQVVFRALQRWGPPTIGFKQRPENHSIRIERAPIATFP